MPCNELRLYYSADMQVITLEVSLSTRLTRHILNLNDENLIDGRRSSYLRAKLWNNFQENCFTMLLHFKRYTASMFHHVRRKSTHKDSIFTFSYIWLNSRLSLLLVLFIINDISFLACKYTL